MIERPYEIVVMFGIFALVIITVGFGVESIYSGSFESSTNLSLFSSVMENVNGTEGLKGLSDRSTEALGAEQEGTGIINNIEQLLKDGFYSLVGLGRSWSIMKKTLDEGVIGDLGIPPIYLTIVAGMLIITFGVIIYTWYKGG